MADMQEDFRPPQIRPPVLNPVQTTPVQAPTPQMMAPVNRTDPSIAMKGQLPEATGLSGPGGMAMLGQAFQARNAQNQNYQFEQETKARQKFGQMAATLDPRDPEAYAKLQNQAMQDPDIAAYGQESLKNLASIHQTITQTAGQKLLNSDNITARMGKLLPQIAANPDNAGALIDAAVKTIPEDGGLRDTARGYFHKSVGLLTEGLTPDMDPKERWAIVRQRFAAGMQGAGETGASTQGLMGTPTVRDGVSGVVAPAQGMRGPDGKMIPGGQFVPSGPPGTGMNGQSRNGGQGTQPEAAGQPGQAAPGGASAPAGEQPQLPAGTPRSPEGLPVLTVKPGDSVMAFAKYGTGPMVVNGEKGWGGVATDGKPLIMGDMPRQGQKPGQLVNDNGVPVPQLNAMQQKNEDVARQEYTDRLPVYAASNASRIQLAHMEQQLDNMAKGGLFTDTGWQGNQRLQAGMAINYIAKQAGMKPPIDESAQASAQDFLKNSTTFGANLAQSSVRGPEAFKTIDMLQQAVPSLANTYLGNKILLAGYRGVAERQVDEKNFMEQWAKAHDGQMAGALSQFNAQHTPEESVNRTLAGFGIDPDSGKFKSANSLKYAVEQKWLTPEQAKDIFKKQGMSLPGQGQPQATPGSSPGEP